MGRKRTNKKAKGLPKDVYLNHNKFQSSFWDGSKLIHVGLFTTPEEAEYRSLVKRNGHHWVGMEAGPFFGFTYLITNKKTGRKYVGKKQKFLWDGPVGGFKCTDMESEWWDPKAWKDNDWEFYTGSSDELNAEIHIGNLWDFSYEILEMCRTKLDLHISEVNHMLKWDVLDALDYDGNYIWYNKNIASLEFRAPFRKQDVVDAKAVTEEAMRNYYLKPKLCSVCSKVIPYGVVDCCKTDIAITKLIKMSLETEGGFKDVR